MGDPEQGAPSVRAWAAVSSPRNGARMVADWAQAAAWLLEDDLVEQLAPLSADTPAWLVALAAVRQGRADDALGHLAAAGVVPPDEDGAISADQVLLAAALAARGDDAAWAWLTWLSQQGLSKNMVLLQARIAAAEARGDRDAVDALTVERLGAEPGSPPYRALPRTFEAWIAARGRGGSVDEIMERLRASAADLVSCEQLRLGSLPFAAPTVRALQARGDAAGAYLLARAMARTAPGFDGWRELLHDATPPRTRVWRALRPWLGLVLFGVGLAATIVLDGQILGVLLGMGAASSIWYVPSLPALTEPERQADRRFRALVMAPVDDPARLAMDTRISGWGVGVAVAIATVLGIGTFGEHLDSIGRTPWWWTSPWGVVLSVPIVLGVGAGAGVLAARSRRPRHARIRRASLDAFLAEVADDCSRCRCGDRAPRSGLRAKMYAERHLGPAVDPGVELPAGAVARPCPQGLGTWLAGPVGAGGEWVLLGSRLGPGDPEPPDVEDPSADEPRGYL